jgi:ParB-like chromosome segregation protein Spo0J
MTVQEIPLKDLVENEYNPRKTFDDAAMEDLKTSIQQIGLVQPLTVRSVDGNWEVISGTRRLKALRDVYDGNHEVPCYVRNVEDAEAKWIALAENLDREELTPIEEAKAYAQYVTVSDDSEDVPFDEYIEEGKASDASLEVPTEKNSSVKSLAERINPNEPEIRDRLKLLVLPDEVQTKVEHNELTLKVAQGIARLRQIADADRRTELMKEVASDSRFIGSNPDLDSLRDRVTSLIEDHKEQEEQQRARIEEFKGLVNQREGDLRATLQSTVDWYNEGHGEELAVDWDDDITDIAQVIIDAYQDKINELGGERFDELDDRQDDLRREKDRLQQNLNVVREENQDRCPFCKAGVNAPDLEERIEEYDREIQMLNEEKQELSEEREDHRELRKEVRKALNDYEDAVERLEQEKEKAAA